ncbi:MAG TPA: hypothetical protein VFO55_11950 [Gemmatimonadaceae bacterium]|nr:hypothetical protein [Gemmatimonadaceae bacterium]
MRALRAAVLVSLVAVTSAHIGSRDTFFNGKAGPYGVSVRVIPPDVVPGIAWAYVRTAETDVDSVAVRPVYWKAGIKGAPPAERADTVAGEKGSFAQKMWLMSTGSYSVAVEVFGRRGRHQVSVPVMAIATSRLGLSIPYAAMLIAFGIVLFAGLVAIVRAAASDSLVEPDREPDNIARRRGSLGAIVTVPILLIAVFGGARWWSAEDARFDRTIYRPLAANATVATTARGHTLRLAVRDTGSQDLLRDPLMLDHGKPMHLFLVKAQSMSAFAHLHPAREPSGVFVTTIPAVPEGRYLVFADLVLETGAEFTVTTEVDVPAAFRDTLSDPDDSWTFAAFGVPAVKGARSQLAPGLQLQWESPDSIVAGKDVLLSFTVRGARNAIVPVQPYLGMPGHAVLIRDDASVFVHLHPMGSMSMASLQAFELRNRGDTTAAGRLVDAHAGMRMDEPDLAGSFSFPFAFPRPGRYRLWVQVKKYNRVLTADYEVVVR